MRGRIWFKVIISLFISGVLLGVLFSWTGFGAVRGILGKLETKYLLLAALSYFIGYVLRAVRFHILLDYGRQLNSVSSRRVLPFFGVICLHNMFNKLLPMRSGELSYMLLMKKYLAARLRTGACSLVMARILDLAAVSMFFLVSSILLAVSGDRSLLTISSGAVAVSVFVAALSVTLGARRISRLFSLKNIAPQGRLTGKIRSRLADAVAGFAHLEVKRHVVPALMVSFAIWGTLYSLFLILMDGFGIEIALPRLIWGSTASVLTIILPLSGLGGFGTHEAGWTAGFLLMGVPEDLCVATGFSVNLFATAMAIVFGLLGFCLIRHVRIEQ